MHKSRKTFIQNVVKIRKSQNLTQAQLSERAGLSNGFICDLENGHRNPTLDTIDKIADALQVAVADLFFDSDASKNPASKEQTRRLIHKLVDELSR